MKVYISKDEKYPFYEVRPVERLIGGVATAMPGGNPPTWELETVEDVLRMSWLDFYDIPEDKYAWIQNTYDELKKIEEYIQGLSKEEETEEETE